MFSPPGGKISLALVTLNTHRSPALTSIQNVTTEVSFHSHHSREVNISWIPEIASRFISGLKKFPSTYSFDWNFSWFERLTMKIKDCLFWILLKKLSLNLSILLTSSLNRKTTADLVTLVPSYMHMWDIHTMFLPVSILINWTASGPVPSTGSSMFWF